MPNILVLFQKAFATRGYYEVHRTRLSNNLGLMSLEVLTLFLKISPLHVQEDHEISWFKMRSGSASCLVKIRDEVALFDRAPSLTISTRPWLAAVWCTNRSCLCVRSTI